MLPPWLQGVDTLGAIRAGSAIGMQERQQRLAEEEAAAQAARAQAAFAYQAAQGARADASAAQELGLKRDQLLQQHLRHATDSQIERESAAARLKQAEAQMQMMGGRYKAQDAIAQERNRIMEARGKQTDPGSAIDALPVYGSDKTLLGHGIRGSGGAVHFVPLKGGLPPRTSDASAAIRSATTMLKEFGTELTPEETATQKEIIKQAQEVLKKTAIPGFREPVAEVTTNAPSWMTLGFGSPTTSTNFVPSTVSAAAALFDPIADFAYRAIQSNPKNLEAIKARYKELTNKELKWPRN